MENNSNININSNINDALTCGICQDIVTLPVHANCCERAKSLNPGCLSCVREYYELNKHPKMRPISRKSWGGCGCDVYLKNNYNINKLYSHTLQLDLIRNIWGPSICHHELCKKSFETCAELRRHLNGSSNDNDKQGNCLYAYTKCKYCNFHGQRIIVDGYHYNKFHSTITCDICKQQVLKKDARIHYNNHKFQMSLLRIKVHDIEKNL